MLAGFAVLLERSGNACELDGLFVEPDRMRGGVGRRLVEDATQIARERDATRIDVVANPPAVAFYDAVGFAPPVRRRPGSDRPRARRCPSPAERSRRFEVEVQPEAAGHDDRYGAWRAALSVTD